MLDIRTFGGLHITRDGVPLSGFATRKVEALLVYLACQSRPCAREVLADLLWDDRPQAQAQANLRAALSRLKRHVPGVVSVDRQSIAVAAGQVWLDAVHLEVELTGAAGDPDRLERALALYTGDFLAGYALRESRGFDDWLWLERNRLRERVLDELEQLVRLYLQQQRAVDALSAARRLVTLDPLREEGHRLLMSVLARRGERAAALAQFDICRQALAAELAVEPSPETVNLRLTIERDGLTPAVPSVPAQDRQPVIRLINTLPQEIAGRYVGHAERQADFRSALAQGARLITIYGRGGIGKTALACKVLTDLQSRPDSAPVAGIVALSALTTGIRLDRILRDLSRLLGQEAAGLLRAVAQDGQVSTLQKVNILLEQIRGSRVLLFLDNLETLQNPIGGELLDPELQTFVEAVVTQSDALCLIVTSREPLGLPRAVRTWERSIPLLDGLPVDEACRLLRAFDPSGAAGLRDAPDAQLRQIAERTHGHPRALEAVAGLLLEQPLLKPADLAGEDSLWAAEVTPVIVQLAIARLDPPAVRVLQGLALFGSPVTRSGLAFLLSPFLDPASLKALLNRLVRAFFARYDSATRLFALHPLDQEYCYSEIPGDDAPFSRRSLHQRAAQYYHHQRKPQAEWLTVDDLAAPLAEFEHLVQAGEYAAAAEVLFRVDRDYLWEWGHKAMLRDLHGRLQGRLSDPRLALASRRRLAWTDWPDAARAATQFEANLQAARRLGERGAEADALDDLAQVARFQADPRAVDLHEQALALYRVLGDQRGEGDALGGAAAAYMMTGHVERAIHYNQQAIAIHRALNQQASLGFTLWSLGGNYTWIGNYDQALGCHQAAIGIYSELNAPRGIALNLASLAQVRSALGDYPASFDALDEAGDIYAALQDPEGTHMILMQRGITLVRQGEIVQALAALRGVQASGIGNRITLTFNTLYLIHALLVSGEILEAQALLAAMPTLPAASLGVWLAVMRGIVQARLDQPETAQATFRAALAAALGLTPSGGHSQFAYLCGLSRAGLAVTNSGPDWLNEALSDFATAQQGGAARGIASQYLQLLEALMVCRGGERLAPLRLAMRAALA